MKLRENTTLQGGKYRIEKVLGQGGFGITYLAFNVMLEKRVAIKEFFPSDFCERREDGGMKIGTRNNYDFIGKLKLRFIKEARNIAQLDHPGIVKIYDIFEENDTAYYVMEHIAGETLQQIVDHNGSMPEETAIDYILKISDALTHIHSHKMTHFDVKPANIMVRRRDLKPILIDFGLSKQYDYKGNSVSTMLPAFSPGYSPLELYKTGNLHEFSPQTDVYSLGATLYFLLTGQTPPDPSEIVMSGLQFPNGIRPELQKIIMDAMHINRIMRLENMIQFAKLLTSIFIIDNNINKKNLERNNSEIVTNIPMHKGGEKSSIIKNSDEKSPNNALPSSNFNPQKEKLEITEWDIGPILIVVMFLVLLIIGVYLS